MKPIHTVAVTILLFLPLALSAQRIMIIPFTQSGEIRTPIARDSIEYRILHVKMTEQLESYGKGLELVDYLEAVTAVRENKLWRTGSTEDRQSLLLDYANPEIYLKTTLLKGTTEANKHWVQLHLQAFRTATSESVGTYELDSGYYEFDNLSDLIGKAFFDRGADGQHKVEGLAQKLFDETRPGSGDILYLEFIVSEDAAEHIDFQMELSDGRYLDEVLIETIKELTLDGRVRPQGGGKRLKFSKILIPDEDWETVVSDYDSPQALSPYDFKLKLRRALENLIPRHATVPLNFDLQLAGSKLFVRVE